MRPKQFISSFLLLLGFLSGETTDGIHFWHAEKFNKTISNNWGLALEQDFRSSDGLYYVHSDLGLKYKINSSLSLSLNFRKSFENKDDQWVSENRPHATLSGKFKTTGLAISGRTRMEYRIKTDKKVFRNRDMLTIKLARPLTRFKLVPYIADEIFYDLEKKEMNRNRAYLGFSIKSIPTFTPTIFLLGQTNLKTDETTAILGIKFSF